MSGTGISKHYRLHFSLRIMFIAVAILCVWLGTEANRLRRQQRAIAAISAKGGEVWYDYQWSIHNDEFPVLRTLTPDATAPGPAWLRKILGDNYCAEVASVKMCGDTFGDDDLLYVKEFRSLRNLDLSKTQVTDEGLKHLRSLKRLGTLSLNGTKVTKKCQESLKEMEGLRVLTLDEGQLATSRGYAARIRDRQEFNAALPNVWIP